MSLEPYPVFCTYSAVRRRSFIVSFSPGQRRFLVGRASIIRSRSVASDGIDDCSQAHAWLDLFLTAFSTGWIVTCSLLLLAHSEDR